MAMRAGRSLSSGDLRGAEDAEKVRLSRDCSVLILLLRAPAGLAARESVDFG